MHYLDANATQALRPAARAAMLSALDVIGNPSSVHQAGRAARRVMEDSREVIARCFGARPADLVFTSGGTEADALAIHALRGERRLIISAIEHDAVRSAAPDAAVVPVGTDGVADIDALDALLSDGVPSLVCLMLANNETGVIQPVPQAAAICRRHGAILHVDAVQAAGRMPIGLAALGAHSLAVSSHKLGGPAGAGALLLAPDAPFGTALIAGGGQERGRRGGTPACRAVRRLRRGRPCQRGRRSRARRRVARCGRMRGRGGGGGGLRRPVAPAAEHDLPRASGRARGCAGHRLRSGGDRRQRGGRMQFRQGGCESCPAGDGPRRAGGPGHPRLAAVECRPGGHRRVRVRVSKRGCPAARPSGAPCRLILSRRMSNLPPRPNRPVYLDNQATTRCDPRVLEAMLPFFTEQFGNPHSAEHVLGRRRRGGG